MLFLRHQIPTNFQRKGGPILILGDFPFIQGGGLGVGSKLHVISFSCQFFRKVFKLINPVKPIKSEIFFVNKGSH